MSFRIPKSKLEATLINRPPGKLAITEAGDSPGRTSLDKIALVIKKETFFGVIEYQLILMNTIDSTENRLNLRAAYDVSVIVELFLRCEIYKLEAPE